MELLFEQQDRSVAATRLQRAACSTIPPGRSIGPLVGARNVPCSGHHGSVANPVGGGQPCAMNSLRSIAMARPARLRGAAAMWAVAGELGAMYVLSHLPTPLYVVYRQGFGVSQL